MTKAILINSAARSITEITVESWRDYAPALGCELFDVARMEAGDLFVDDEGLLGDPEAMTWFMLEGQVFSGSGLLLGKADEEGNATDTPLSVEDVEGMVKFVRPRDPVGYVDHILHNSFSITTM